MKIYKGMKIPGPEVPGPTTNAAERRRERYEERAQEDDSPTSEKNRKGRIQLTSTLSLWE